jgi:hypothetical protein
MQPSAAACLFRSSHRYNTKQTSDNSGGCRTEACHSSNIFELLALLALPTGMHTPEL